ncbi:MAG: alpha/beta hydrolase [Chthoniobacter sp.]|uniref:alpha/beta hydrolase n=1 Tax=Chthoniobacter sp. TaxID=2510640 RepID=UPI0032A2C9F2
MNRLLCCVAIGLFSLRCALSLGAEAVPVDKGKSLSPGAGRFDFSHADKTVPVWYYVPAEARADTPVLIVMHGVGRDASRYRDDWVPYAQKLHFMVVVPEFSVAAFPGSAAYAQGGTVDAKGHALPRAQWAFSFIEPIFDAFKAATGNRSERYFLYGHSAGAQFVHRYLYFVPEARVAKAVAANAGWWTLPDPAVNFPYGLHGSAVESAALKTALQRPLIVLLGTADTDPEAENLRKTPEALAQGPNRLTRGHTFFDAGKHRAETLGVPFGWQLALAPGIGHKDGGMATFAAPLLFDHSVVSGVVK